MLSPTNPDPSNAEKLIRLSRVPKLKFLPRRSRGNRYHVSTIYRWASRGFRGIKLRTVRVGGVKCTRRGWLSEFFAALTNADSHTVQQITPASRQRDVDRACRQLDELLGVPKRKAPKSGAPASRGHDEAASSPAATSSLERKEPAVEPSVGTPAEVPQQPGVPALPPPEQKPAASVGGPLVTPWVFRRRQRLWEVKGGSGELGHVRDMKGMADIWRLLSNRAVPVAAIDLNVAPRGLSKPDSVREVLGHEDGGQGINIMAQFSRQDQIDPEAKSAAENALADFREDLRSAERRGNTRDADEAREKIAKTEAYLREAINKFHGLRSFGRGSAADQVRQSVSKRLKRACHEIEMAGHPDLAKHLLDSVEPDGNYGFTYRPVGASPEWDLG